MQGISQAPELDQTGSPPTQSFPWAPLLWYGLLIAALFADVIRTMVREWMDDESMGHGFFVPFVSLYIIWQLRDKLMAVPLRPHWSGVLLITWGFCQLMLGFLGAEFFVMRTALLVTILGVVVAVCGWPMVKAMSFPLFLLLFMIRIPQLIYGQVTFPLQLFASQVAEYTLGAVGIAVLREGNILELPSQRLSVVEACSGIRSLLSLSFLSLVYGYFFDERPWMKWALLVATVPIAIIANAARVSLTGILSEFNKELATGVYHTFEGWVVFMVALVALLAAHQVLSRGVNWYRLRRAV